MWFAMSAGTGVWFNLGRTISFNEHGDAFAHFDIAGAEENQLAPRARAAGYDTVQFLKGDSSVTPCCTKLGLGALCQGFTEFVSTRLNGTFPCGGDDSQSFFRAGWNATRPCECSEANVGPTADPTDASANYINCKGFASEHARYAHDAKRDSARRRRETANMLMPGDEVSEGAEVSPEEGTVAWVCKDGACGTKEHG